MNTDPIPKCGQRDCPNPHPSRPWVERQRAVSVPVVAGVPTGAIGNTLTATPTWQPEWLRRLQPKDFTGSAA